jgi:hypothetical protein
VTGCSEAKLIERVLFALVGRTTPALLGRQVFSYRRGRPVEARRLYTDAFVTRGVLRGGVAAEDELIRVLGDDIGLVPEQVERLAMMLSIPPPSWLVKWQAAPPDPAGAAPAPPDPAGAMPASADLLDQMLVQYDAPAKHPGGRKGFFNEFRSRAAGGDRRLTDEGIRTRFRRKAGAVPRVKTRPWRDPA